MLPPEYCPSFFDSVHVEWANRRFDIAVRNDNVGSVSLEVRDSYILRGAMAGVPVQFTARLVSSGTLDAPCFSSGCRPSTVYRILAGGQELAWGWTYGLTTFMNLVTQAALVRPAGETFPLEFEVAGNTAHEWNTIDCTTRVEFVDLPPGVWIESCLSSDSPTDARRSSWGRLKSLYR